MSSNSEVSRESISAVPVRTEPRRSSLSKSQTIAIHRTAPLKEESISLSWPLVKFADRPRLAKPLLHFDVGFDPRLPRNLGYNRSGEWSPLSETDRNLPVATHCTLTKMVIHCPKIGEITVKKSEGIRCIDVLAAVYDAYHERLKRDEWPQDIEWYKKYFDQRCRNCASNTEAERRAGMRRVDLLRGKRIFDGLLRSGADWKLEFSL
ncbi:hypothetical protein B0H19DRAFT_1110164 [Mycena capillaripes]|nr:hypothetical protein B0H19DRAFT_1110164 [Mycena capillaripes]